MAQVVGQADRLHEVFVEAQGAGDGASDLGDLQGVGQAGAVVIAGGGDEYLGLVLQPAERFGMDDAIAVALKGRSHRIRGFGPGPAP